MKCLLQRVTRASVTVGEEVVGQINQGLLVLVGVEPEDTGQTVSRMSERLLKYRVFSDSESRMNLNVEQAGGAILLVSQFTLAADTASGNRPGFSTAAKPEQALRLCEDLAEKLALSGIQVETGQFGAHMLVSLTNDGPVTFLLAV
jgi:D-tyrosyl-tRNA(Tyr) deacylase